MKSIPIALQEHFLQDVATLATCWLIELADGTNIRGTDHDQDIVITSPTGHAGTYYGAVNITASDVTSSSDMSVDNMEVNGALQQYVEMPDLTVARIESGIADKAPVTVFLCNWQAPDDGQVVIRRGYLGEFTRDTNGAYRTEVRGLTQLLSQTIGGTFGTRCAVKRLGDSECKKDIGPLTRTGVVASVTSRRAFTVTLTPGTAPPSTTFFSAGVMTFTSGDNDNFVREVKKAPVSAGVATVELWDEAPEDIAVGDTLTLEPGCNRTTADCKDVFDNLINFRGYGLFIPGIDEIMAGPTSSSRAPAA